jgi:hypothetical protein
MACQAKHPAGFNCTLAGHSCHFGACGIVAPEVGHVANTLGNEEMYQITTSITPKRPRNAANARNSCFGDAHGGEEPHAAIKKFT